MIEAGRVPSESMVECIFKVDNQKKFRAKGLLIHHINCAIQSAEESVSRMRDKEIEEIILISNELIIQILQRFIMCFGLTRNILRDVS